MTKDDIIKLALDAGFCHDINNGIYLCAPMHIERFAALVAELEREACAKVCEELKYTGFRYEPEAPRLAARIRARE